MFQKSIFLIFLATIFLSFNYQIKTMEEPNKKRKIDSEEQEDEFPALKNEEQEDKLPVLKKVNSLKFLAASKYLQKLVNGLENVNMLKILNIVDSDENLLQDLKDYCKYLIIDQHCAFCRNLEPFKPFKDDAFDSDQPFDICLDEYRKLLYDMVNHSHPEFNLILSIFDNHFRLMFKYFQKDEQYIKEYCGIKIDDVNILLKGLIKRTVFKDMTFKEIFANEYVLFDYSRLLCNLIENQYYESKLNNIFVILVTNCLLNPAYFHIH